MKPHENQLGYLGSALSLFYRILYAVLGGGGWTLVGVLGGLFNLECKLGLLRDLPPSWNRFVQGCS